MAKIKAIILKQGYYLLGFMTIFSIKLSSSSSRNKCGKTTREPQTGRERPWP